MTNSATFPGTVTATSYEGSGANLTGISAGFDPAVDKIAIGNGAGTTTQGADCIAIGHDAGSSGTQGNHAVAVGPRAGMATQGADCVAIGNNTGETSQGANAVAIGVNAGSNAQGAQAIAIGFDAGKASQGTNAIAIGYLAGSSGTQGTSATAVGHTAGQATQGNYCTAIGYQAGYSGQGDVNQASAVAIGREAGYNAQEQDCTAMGRNAGGLNQGEQSVALGYAAAYQNQGNEAVAIGSQCGQIDQGNYCVAVGRLSGFQDQQQFGTAVGYSSGRTNQGHSAVAIGSNAGCQNQGTNCIAIGVGAQSDAAAGEDIAIGVLAGSRMQRGNAIAIGYLAGRYNQGPNAVAIGNSVFSTGSQPGNTTFVRLNSVADTNGNEYLHITSAGQIVRGNGYSDDRLKYDEKFITGAVKSLFKLRPQEYLKKPKIIPHPDRDEAWIHESGLMAQEVYYSAPEMRHLVTVADIAGDVDTLTPAPSDDPAQDPDYSVWGDKPSGIKYIQFIPYLIKGIQEIVTELPRSKTTVSNTWEQNITGLVVSAKMNTYKTNVTPIVSLSNVAMDKAWYGVVSDQKTDTNDYDTLVDINGDTRIWVSDVGGSLESGDLVTTSNIAPGYAQKQSDDIVRNYTVGKVTQDCDFTEPLQVSVKIPKKELSNVKYYVKNIIREVELNEYELYNTRHTTVETKPMYICEVQKGVVFDNERYYSGGVETGLYMGEETTKKWFLEKTPDEYELLDDEEKVRYTLGTRNIYKIHSQTRSSRLIPEHEEEVFIEEMADVLDGNGQIVWEETDETEPIYTLVNHGTHKAALLTCKLD